MYEAVPRYVEVLGELTAQGIFNKSRSYSSPAAFVSMYDA
jgi:hypothetical protein